MAIPSALARHALSGQVGPAYGVLLGASAGGLASAIASRSRVSGLTAFLLGIGASGVAAICRLQGGAGIETVFGADQSVLLSTFLDTVATALVLLGLVKTRSYGLRWSLAELFYLVLSAPNNISTMHEWGSRNGLLLLLFRSIEGLSAAPPSQVRSIESKTLDPGRATNLEGLGVRFPQCRSVTWVIGLATVLGILAVVIGVGAGEHILIVGERELLEGCCASVATVIVLLVGGQALLFTAASLS